MIQLAKMNKRQTLSVIINSGNEEHDLPGCLESLSSVDEVIVCLSQRATDKTGEIAKKFGAKVVVQEPIEMDYAAWHNQGMKIAKSDWLLWIDADERLTPALKKEIETEINSPKGEFTAYAIPRKNFLLNKELRWGGWYPDYAKRLFNKKYLKNWVGNLHEQPVIEGNLGKLTEPMLHLQPADIEPAFQKSIRWSLIEARLLQDAKHPKIVWWRVLRMGFTTLFERLFKKQGFRDGVEGWIESIYQAYHTMIVYLRLWELQSR